MLSACVNLVNTVYDYPLSVAGYDESGTDIVPFFFLLFFVLSYITTGIVYYTNALLWLASTPPAELYFPVFN